MSQVKSLAPENTLLREKVIVMIMRGWCGGYE